MKKFVYLAGGILGAIFGFLGSQFPQYNCVNFAPSCYVYIDSSFGNIFLNITLGIVIAEVICFISLWVYKKLFVKK